MKYYTNEQILKVFDNSINDVSAFISKLSDYKNQFDVISNQTLDNADPLCEASECLERLGLLLAILNIYKKEYTEGPIDEQTGRIVRE